MKVKSLLVIVLLMAGYLVGQSKYPLVTLQQINAYADSTGKDTSTAYWNTPLAGDTVRVQAMVMVSPIINPNSDRRTIFYYGLAYGCWVQDGSNKPWSGLEVYQADTSDPAKATGFDLCDTSSVYEFTGVVTPYGQSTELALITTPTPIPVNLISQEPTRPAPIPLTIDSCWNSQGAFNLDLRKYEGMYVSFVADATHHLITSNLITVTTSTGGGFTINDTLGHSINMYAQSKYYKTGANYTLRPSYVPPPNGSSLPYVRGILEAYYTTAGVWTWEIVPMYPGDLGEPVSSPPAISKVVRSPGVVPLNDSIKVTCQVIGLIGAKVTGVQLYYDVNGVAQSPITMNKINGTLDSNYTCTMPPITTGDSSFVDYWVKAVDNDNLSSTNPQNTTTSRYSFFVFSDPNKPLTIQHVRYSPWGSGFSSYNGYPVTISGVVTSDTSNIPGGGTDPTRVYIQNGTTPWSGIILGYAGPVGTNVSVLKQGDLITISGTPVLANSSGTRLDTITALTVISHNNPLPAAHLMKTGDVGYSPLGTLTAEPWNSCIVTYQGVTIDSANVGSTTFYAESYCKDSSGGNHTMITWGDGRTQFWDGPTNVLVTKGDYFGSITGILGFTFSGYKITPRNDNDITGYVPFVPNGITDKNLIPAQYKLNQNFPNPFNPSTTISYNIPNAGIVNIKIFNVLGQLVKTLVNQTQTAGTHQITFNANTLTSGVYFYSLTVNNFTQVKKMMLLK
ncbi:MAG: T9SS type A sorting domain-containing protein [Ignavibacteriaceae bacterium]|nr:T9SS type A sorting domain-containing protein [Ignavibacteriaceae bacterium]